MTRPKAGYLSVEPGTLASAATRDCLDYLHGIRAQRARLRGLVGGRRFFVLLLIMCVLALVLLAGIAARQWSEMSDAYASAPAIELVLSALGGIVSGLVAATAVLGVRRYIGGTRLTTPPMANYSWLTSEIGVLAAVAGVAVALIIGVIMILIQLL